MADNYNQAGLNPEPCIDDILQRPSPMPALVLAPDRIQNQQPGVPSNGGNGMASREWVINLLREVTIPLEQVLEINLRRLPDVQRELLVNWANLIHVALPSIDDNISGPTGADRKFAGSSDDTSEGDFEAKANDHQGDNQKATEDLLGVTDTTSPGGNEKIRWYIDASTISGHSGSEQKGLLLGGGAAPSLLTITPFAKTVLDDADAATARATLGAGTLSNVIEDTTPQLGGDLDVNGKKLVSVSNGDIAIEPNGTGSVTVSKDLKVDTDVLYVDTTNNRVGVNTPSPAFEFEAFDSTGNCVVKCHSDGGDPTFMLDGTNGQQANVQYREDNVNRWQLRADYASSNELFLLDDSATKVWQVSQGCGANTLFLVNTGVGVKTGTVNEALTVSGNAQIDSIGSGTFSAAVNQTSNGTLTDQTSDRRLKKDVSALRVDWEQYNRLRPSWYRWLTQDEYYTNTDAVPHGYRHHEPKDNRLRMGFIAQEMQDVFPGLVRKNKVDGYLATDHNELIAMNVAAIQDLYRMVMELQAR